MSQEAFAKAVATVIVYNTALVMIGFWARGLWDDYMGKRKRGS